jgi:Tol biopolymer transport system component
MVAGGGLYAPALNPWSGDSTQVLYYADQQTDETYELFAAAANGSGNVKVNGTLALNADVPCCDTFSWSPDSNYVSYTANQSTVVDAYLWNRTTGTRTVLDSAGPTTVLHNAWSPNGQKLAFFGDSQSGVGWRKLYIANNNGGNATLASGTMSSGGSFAYYTNLVFNQPSYRPAWSPDSSRYLYAADKNIDGVLELFAATADGSRNIKVSEAVATGTGIDGHGFGWSNDGKKVIYIQDIGGMFALFSNDSLGGTPINLSGDLLVQGTAINYAGPTY